LTALLLRLERLLFCLLLILMFHLLLRRSLPGLLLLLSTLLLLERLLFRLLIILKLQLLLRRSLLGVLLRLLSTLLLRLALLHGLAGLEGRRAQLQQLLLGGVVGGLQHLGPVGRVPQRGDEPSKEKLVR
jgi:hypothetical protein